MHPREGAQIYTARDYFASNEDSHVKEAQSTTAAETVDIGFDS